VDIKERIGSCHSSRMHTQNLKALPHLPSLLSRPPSLPPLALSVLLFPLPPAPFDALRPQRESAGPKFGRVPPPRRENARGGRACRW
jgi:hypothetical protein